MDQLHLAPLIFFFLHLLSRAVQKEALIEQFAVFLQKLDISHHMNNISVLMPDAVFHTDAVAFFFQRTDVFPEFNPVFFHNRACHHVKSVRKQLLLRFIPQNLQGSLIDAENTASVQRMRHYAAVHGSKDHLQHPVFLHQFLFVGALLCNINSDPHCPHHASVKVVQRRLVGGKQPCAASGHDGFL